MTDPHEEYVQEVARQLRRRGSEGQQPDLEALHREAERVMADRLVTFWVEYVPISIPIRPGKQFQVDTIKPKGSSLRRPDIVSDVSGKDYIRCIWVDET